MLDTVEVKRIEMKPAREFLHQYPLRYLPSTNPIQY
jgi:hypothetical protein